MSESTVNSCYIKTAPIYLTYDLEPSLKEGTVTHRIEKKSNASAQLSVQKAQCDSGNRKYYIRGFEDCTQRTSLVIDGANEILHPGQFPKGSEVTSTRSRKVRVPHPRKKCTVLLDHQVRGGLRQWLKGRHCATMTAGCTLFVECPGILQ